MVLLHTYAIFLSNFAVTSACNFCMYTFPAYVFLVFSLNHALSGVTCKIEEKWIA